MSWRLETDMEAGSEAVLIDQALTSLISPSPLPLPNYTTQASQAFASPDLQLQIQHHTSAMQPLAFRTPHTTNSGSAGSNDPAPPNLDGKGKGGKGKKGNGKERKEPPLGRINILDLCSGNPKRPNPEP